MIKHFCIGGRYTPANDTIEDIYFTMESENILFQVSWASIQELLYITMNYNNCRDKEKPAVLQFEVMRRGPGDIKVYIYGEDATWAFSSDFLLEMEEFLK